MLTAGLVTIIKKGSFIFSCLLGLPPSQLLLLLLQDCLQRPTFFHSGRFCSLSAEQSPKGQMGS